MKQFITAAAFLAASTALANASVVFSDNTETNYNCTLHGFQFSLSAMTAPETIATGTEFSLDSLTYRCATGNNAGFGVEFSLLVLNLNDNTVLGYSNQSNTTVKNNTLTFTFSAIGGGDLVVSYDTTYRFLAVSSDVVSFITNADESITTFIYNAGGTSDATSTTSDGTMTITRGLKAPGARGHWDSNSSAIVNAFIAGSNGTTLASATVNNVSGNIGSVVTSVTATAIPEPSAFGLLASAGALALVAARRRRSRTK